MYGSIRRPVASCNTCRVMRRISITSFFKVAMFSGLIPVDGRPGLGSSSEHCNTGIPSPAFNIRIDRRRLPINCSLTDRPSWTRNYITALYSVLTILPSHCGYVYTKWVVTKQLDLAIGYFVQSVA